MRDEGLDFSFSGLKTAVVNHVRHHAEVDTADVAASFQAAVVDVLVAKALRAADTVGVDTVCLAGGVAANSRLRSQLAEEGERSAGGCWPQPGHVHRQRRHGRRGRLVAATSGWVPHLLTREPTPTWFWVLGCRPITRVAEGTRLGTGE